jgi:hypothetical protein
MAVNLSRKAKVFITSDNLSPVTPVFTIGNTFELQILNDWSFSQTTNSTTVEMMEAGPAPKRGQRTFNDSMNPVEWSFSTYIRPYDAGTTAAAPEGVLWSALMSDSLGSFVQGVSTATVDTTGSDVHQLATFGLVFVLDQSVYVIENCAINQAEVSFDITGIASVTWSGMGTKLKRVSTAPVAGTTATGFPIQTTYVGYDRTYITNKLSSVELSSGFSGGTTYNVPITGGTFTYSNNIEYIIPDTLGLVDRAIGYYTGSRAISGSITAYLKTGTNETAQLLQDVLTVGENNPEPKFRLAINVGGTQVGYPSVKLDMPYTTVQTPTIEVADIISTTIAFNAQGATANEFDIEANNNLVVTYKPVMTP